MAEEITRVLIADAEPTPRESLAAALAAERDLELLPPASTPAELAQGAPFADVVVLVGDLATGLGEAAALVTHRVPGRAWVVLVRSEGDAWSDVDGIIEDVLVAGADGALVVTSTPLQILGAIRAAARGERAPMPGTDDSTTGPLVRRVPRPKPPLGTREIEVLRLIGHGLGNQEIARRLYLSVSSVKSHLSHAYGRLGVNNREAAVAEARRQELIE